MITEQQFDAMTDAAKIMFLSDLLRETTESLNTANALIRELTGINEELFSILKGTQEND